MHDPAQGSKIQVLITDISSPLGAELANTLLANGVTVYGLGKKNLSPHLLIKKNFTLLDLDLSQPLPSNLPRFDQIFHLVGAENHHISSEQNQLSPLLRNLLDIAVRAESRVAIILPINCNLNLLDFLATRIKTINQLNLYLVGDTYGPQMHLHETVGLPAIIAQAILSDRIILPNEGLDMLFPTYLQDAADFLAKTVFEPQANDKVGTIVSNNPQNALTIGYTIQKLAGLLLNKEIGLFFAGSPQDSRPRPAPSIEVHKLVKTTALEQGLAQTFNHFMHQVKAAAPQNTTPNLQRVNYQQFVPQEDKLAKFRKFKAPKFSIKSPKIRGSKAKLITFAVIGLLILLIVKTTTEILLGVGDLKATKTAIEAANWK
ncbi:hypothetical protein HY024_02860, partial [Candidatus Curtissbacteria bacterium]|nr:hypothetical protein [Candidatus Curtissbacteria bacterium]